MVKRVKRDPRRRFERTWRTRETKASIVRDFNAAMVTALGAKGIDEDAIARLRATASDIYNEIGYDMGWADTTPSDDEFVDVLRDRMRDSLDETDLPLWEKLTVPEKRWLLLKVL